MFIYQLRPYFFKTKDGKDFQFPSRCVLNFELHPGQPFGAEVGGGTNLVQSSADPMYFNASTGQRYSHCSLKPLSAQFDDVVGPIRINGNVVTIEFNADDYQHLWEQVTGILYAHPPLLNLTFADAPTIVTVNGRVGAIAFELQVKDHTFRFEVTTQENQEAAFRKSCEYMVLTSDPANLRLVAAAHYCHVACRLLRSAETPGEFLSEVVLNLTKILQALFGETQDKVRAGLRGLGYPDEEIERDYTAIMAVRHHLDVGHVLMSSLTDQQLNALHKFVEGSPDTFRKMLRRVFDEVQSGRYKPSPQEYEPIDRDKAKVIERIVARANEPRAQESGPKEGE